MKAALVTGASRGIGLALAEALADTGHALTLTARKPGPLEETAQRLRDAGHDVQALAAPADDEAALQAVVALHRERHGRLDVLVNNAGVGIGAPADGHHTRHVDLQLAVNVRAMVLMYRETIDLLKADGGAQVVNLASIAGKSGQGWLSVYSATKAAVIGYTQAMNQELGGDGVKSCAFCPGFVATDMTEFVREHVPAEEMISTADIAQALRFLLTLSPACVVPEIVFARPGDAAF